MSDNLPLSEPTNDPQPLASSCADTLTKTSPDPLEDNIPSSESSQSTNCSAELQQCDNQTEPELQRPQSPYLSDNLPLPELITDPPSQPLASSCTDTLTERSPDPLEDNIHSSESSQSTNCSAEQPQLCDNQTNPEQTCQLQDEIVPLSGKPFFTCILSKSNTEPLYQLVVPRNFCSHLPSEIVPVTLKCRNKRWQVNFHGDRSLKIFDALWKNFAVDNNLRVGDACVFELVDTKDLTFKVQILDGSLPAIFLDDLKGHQSDALVTII